MRAHDPTRLRWCHGRREVTTAKRVCGLGSRPDRSDVSLPQTRGFPLRVAALSAAREAKDSPPGDLILATVMCFLVGGPSQANFGQGGQVMPEDAMPDVQRAVDGYRDR